MIIIYDEKLELILAGILYNKNELLDYDIIDKDDFYTEVKHAINKMIKLRKNGSVIDAVTIGRDFEVPDIKDIERFEDLVLALKTLNKERKLQELPKQITNIVLDKSDYETKIVKLREKIDSIETSTSNVDEFSVSKLIKEYREFLNNSDRPELLRTGVSALDAMLGEGFQKGDLVLVAGETGGFKSTLIHNITLNAALRGENVLFFTYEMNRNEINKIYTSILSRVNSLKLKLRDLNVKEKEQIEEALCVLESLDNIYIFDNNARLSDIKLIGLQKKPSIVIIDYLQIMPDMGKESVTSIEYITRQLKMMTGSSMLNCTIILLSQFSRAEKTENGGRQTKRNLQDLKGSGAIEQNANIVMFTESSIQAEEWKEGIKETIKIHIKKNRSGPTGEISIPIDRTTHWIDPNYLPPKKGR